MDRQDSNWSNGFCCYEKCRVHIAGSVIIRWHMRPVDSFASLSWQCYLQCRIIFPRGGCYLFSAAASVLTAMNWFTGPGWQSMMINSFCARAQYGSSSHRFFSTRSHHQIWWADQCWLCCWSFWLCKCGHQLDICEWWCLHKTAADFNFTLFL